MSLRCDISRAGPPVGPILGFAFGPSRGYVSGKSGYEGCLPGLLPELTGEGLLTRYSTAVVTRTNAVTTTAASGKGMSTRCILFPRVLVFETRNGAFACTAELSCRYSLMYSRGELWIWCYGRSSSVLRETSRSAIKLGDFGSKPLPRQLRATVIQGTGDAEPRTGGQPQVQRRGSRESKLG